MTNDRARFEKTKPIFKRANWRKLFNNKIIGEFIRFGGTKKTKPNKANILVRRAVFGVLRKGM